MSCPICGKYSFIENMKCENCVIYLKIKEQEESRKAVDKYWNETHKKEKKKWWER